MCGKSRSQIPKRSAPGVDGQEGIRGEGDFEGWMGAMLQSIHRRGYRAPEIRRVYIPKPGKQEKRPLGVPCIATGHSSAARHRCSQLYTNRTFCHAPLADVLGWAPITHSPRLMS